LQVQEERAPGLLSYLFKKIVDKSEINWPCTEDRLSSARDLFGLAGAGRRQKFVKHVKRGRVMAKNRKKILGSALRLFNEYGTGSISTNHIAEDCEISPGNLYYHFANKEEIIVTLLENYRKHVDDLLSSHPFSGSVSSLYKMIYDLDDRAWEVRFLYAEMSSLSRQYASIRKIMGDFKKQMIKQFELAFRQFEKGGAFKKRPDKKFIDALVQACWILSTFGVANLEVDGSLTRKNLKKEGDTLKELFRPFFN